MPAALINRHSASTKQLDSLFATRAEFELQWLLSSAETVEMPRVLSECCLYPMTEALIEQVPS